MRIAFVHQPVEPGVVPPSSSVAIWAHEAALRLKVRHDVTAYARADGFRARVEDHEGIRWRFAPIGPDRWLERLAERALPSHPNRPRFSAGTHYLGYILRIALDLRRQPAPVVQLFNFSQFAPVVRALNPRARICLRMSCEWLTQVDPSRIAPRLETVDMIIGCSDYITEGIQRAFPRFADRCVTIHNGRDVHALAPPEPTPSRSDPEARRLLYVGRVSPEKGVHVLIEAFARCAAENPGWTLEIIGGRMQLPYDYAVGLEEAKPRVRALARFYAGEDRTSYVTGLEARVRELGLADRVRFTEPVPHADLVARYHAADVLVFPSVWDEPSGNPPIEAMAAGTPVISTRTGGTAEYVDDGTTGQLVPPDDDEALAVALRRVLDDEERRLAMGAAARRHAVARFSYERLAEVLEARYRALCEAPGR